MTAELCYWEPEIPGNSGAAIRLCAVAGSKLHLIKPLGFDLSDAQLKRAGLDYHDLTEVEVYENFDEFIGKIQPRPGEKNRRIIAFTSRGENRYDQIQYRGDDILLFGRESVGLSDEILNHPAISLTAYLPMVKGVRSMNLTNTASVALFEAWKQADFS